MISSTISFILASLVLNSVSTSFAAPIRFTPRDNIDALAPRAYTPGAGENKLSRRIVQKDPGINELRSSSRGGPITIVSSVTTVLKDGIEPGTIDLISTTKTVVENGKGKTSCSGRPPPKKTCGKKKASATKPGKNCGKKSGSAGGTNSTIVPPGPSNSSNSTTIPEIPPPGGSNSTSVPPTTQPLPILPDEPSNDTPSNGTILIQEPNNNSSTTTTPGDAPDPQPVRRHVDGGAKPTSEPPKSRETKRRLDKRNRMSFS